MENNDMGIITQLMEAVCDFKAKFKHCDTSNMIGDYYLAIATTLDHAALEQCEKRNDQGVLIVHHKDFKKYITPTEKINTTIFCVQNLINNVDIPRFTSKERFLSNDYKVSKIILQIQLLLKELAGIEEVKGDMLNELIELLRLALPELTAEFLKKNFVEKNKKAKV